MKMIQKTIFAMVAHVIAGVLLVGSAAAAPRPNIILCMADDMGWGDPSYNSMTITNDDGSPHPDQGWISTPTMDAMAASGIRFDRFYSASAVCSPTRASCLTGRNPFRVGVPNANSGHLGADETPLSEILSQVGYRCGHFGKWHLGTLTTLRDDANRGTPGDATHYSAPWHHEYDACLVTESKVPTWHPYRKASNGTALPTSFTDSNFYGTHYWRMPTTDFATAEEGDVVPTDGINNLADGDDSRMLAQEAIDFMRTSVSNSEPFFVVLWFHTPHKPIVDPEGVSGVDSSDACKDAIEDMDEAMGMVRAELDALGVRSNTMFWVTSDNGPEGGVNSPNDLDADRPFRSGRMRERKRSVYDGGTRVPGILEWPAVIPVPFASEYPAFTSDYYPTIVDYLELSVPNQKPLDGMSLRPMMEGSTTNRAAPMGVLYGSKKSWIGDRYKLVSEGSVWELYDYDQIAVGELAEQTPLATASNVGSKSQAIQDLYNSLLAEFNAWKSTVDNDTAYAYASAPTVQLSTAASTVTNAFTVDVLFNEPVTGLGINDFLIVNGSILNFSGSSTSWTLEVEPIAPGLVSVAVSAGAVFNLEGAPNASGDTLEVSTPAPPIWLENPIQGNDGNVGFVYSGTLDGLANDVNQDPITYGLIDTNTWLTVAADGTLGGTPVLADFGSNTFTVSASDVDGANNAVLNILVTDIPPPPPLTDFPITTAVDPVEWQTVDLVGNVPGDQDNNLSKFTAVPGDLYLRSSSSADERRVRAHVRFDLSAFTNYPVSQATLSFKGYSLNTSGSVNLQTYALAADWNVSGAPLPTFEHAVIGTLHDGGNIATGLVSDVRTYSMDVTEAVTNWISGAWPNYGLQFQLSDVNINNGIEIYTVGEGAIQLVVEEKAPLELTGSVNVPQNGGMTLSWTSVSGLTYQLEYVGNLTQTNWNLLDSVTSTSTVSSYTHTNGLTSTSGFYRVSTELIP